MGYSSSSALPRWSRDGSGLSGDELQVVVDDDREFRESDGLESDEERRRIDRVVVVTLVEVMKAVARQAVRSRGTCRPGFSTRNASCSSSCWPQNVGT